MSSISNEAQKYLTNNQPLLDRLWQVLDTASCGPEGTSGSISDARLHAGQDWAAVQDLFVVLASLVDGASDWGVLGLDVEAAVRSRVVLQSLHQPELYPRWPWPPEGSQGHARAPWDLLHLGNIMAEQSDVYLEDMEYAQYPADVWLQAFKPVVGAGGSGPTTFMLDQRWRRARIETLDGAVERWARTGPHVEVDDTLWDAVGHDGLQTFLGVKGANLLGGSWQLAAQLRTAIVEAHAMGSADLTNRVQWLAALRTVLAGRLVMMASRSLADIRPWSHDTTLAWTRDFLRTT